jgi:acetolactate synthase-1/2/3 large subunit
MFSHFAEDAGRDERPFDLSMQLPARAWPEPARLQQLLQKLNAAKRPVLIGGHGVWWAKAEAKLEEAGQLLGIPVFNIPYHQKLLGEECEGLYGACRYPSISSFRRCVS